MASGIKAAPNEYDFGLHFNWSTWLIGTELTLCNVPWNNDYRDICYTDDPAGVDNYIDNISQNYTLHNANTQRFESNVKIPLPINAAIKFNYLRVRNPVQPNSLDVQRTYYYFILDVIYRSFNSTELVLQLDVWQTFGREIAFGPCFVEQGHVGIANSKNFQNYGRDYLTEAEGLDIGSEYRIVHVENENVIANSDGVQPWILICSAADLTIDPGDASSPTLHAAKGGTIGGLPTGAEFYYFRSVAAFQAFMTAFATRPWVTQAILSITAIPPLTRYYTNVELGDPLTIQGSDYIIDNIYRAPANIPGQIFNKAQFPAWRDSLFLPHVLGTRYGNLLKFFTSPYLMIELTTFTGSPIIIKPEMWQDANATMKEIISLVPPGQRIAFIPNKYNSSGETLPGQGTETDNDFVGQDDYGEFLDFAAFLDNFPGFPLVNNMAIGFLAANKNGLAFQFANASWDQQRALAGAQAGVDIGSAGIQNTSAQGGIEASLRSQILNNNMAVAPYAAIAGVLGSVGGAAAGGEEMMAGSAAAGSGSILGQALQAGATVQNTTAQNAATAASTLANVRNQATVRDTNADYARFAAKGDYGMQVRAVTSKIQDAKLNQPSTSGQFGGDSFNLSNRLFGYSLRWKFINSRLVNVIGEIWLRYGYRIHQYMTPPANFQCMEKFTYWKFQEVYIKPPVQFPEKFKQTIRGIFEKGVTVWRDPSYIGTTDFADNAPVTADYY